MNIYKILFTLTVLINVNLLRTVNKNVIEMLKIVAVRNGKLTF